MKANSILVNDRRVTIASPTKDENEKNCIGNASIGNGKENTPLSNANNKNNSINNCDEKEIASLVPKQQISIAEEASPILSRPRSVIAKEISKQVLRHKLQKLRHLVLQGAISEDYLGNEIFPKLLETFDPQTVNYNGGIANVKEWKISCYLEVMEGGIPCTNPHIGLKQVFLPLLETCDDLFLGWYKQQHSCNHNTKHTIAKRRSCKRIMTFVTRYTPAPGEQALLKHIDGAGKVDGSVVVALPTDDSWHGHGGGLTFWDGRERIETETNTETTKQKLAPPGKPSLFKRFRPREIHYQTRSGDIAFIDRAVWHQADPITKGTRWALVIFYKVTEEEEPTTNKDESKSESPKSEE